MNSPFSMKRTVVAVLGLFAALALRAEPVFIANPAVPESALSADEVKNALLGNKTKWDSGGVIKLVVLSEGPLHDDVVKARVQRTSDQFDKHWKKLVFTGKGTLPQQAKSEADVVAYVSQTPGALGYVDRANATAAVKILSVP